MTPEELYNVIICAGGCVVPNEGGNARIKLPPGALADLRDELRRRRAELAAVAVVERRDFAIAWRADVERKKSGYEPGIERWTRADWAVWARTMIAIWAAEEMPENGAERELRWLRGLAGAVKKSAVA